MYSKNNNGGHLLSPVLHIRTSLLLVSLVFTSTFLCVCGDDTQALRNTLSSLCSINSGGEFGSCCKTHNPGSVNIKEKNTWECFARDIGSSDDLNVTSLFVFVVFLFHFHPYFHTLLFRNFTSIGLTLLADNIFSGLTNLLNLPFLLFYVLYSWCSSLFLSSQLFHFFPKRSVCWSWQPSVYFY